MFWLWHLWVARRLGMEIELAVWCKNVFLFCFCEHQCFLLLKQPKPEAFSGEVEAWSWRGTWKILNGLCANHWVLPWVSPENSHTARLQMSAGAPGSGEASADGLTREVPSDLKESSSSAFSGSNQSCCSFALKVWGKGLLSKIQAALVRSSSAIAFCKEDLMGRLALRSLSCSVMRHRSWK